MAINNSDIPTNYGLGASYFIPQSQTEILLDYEYSSHYKDGIHVALIQSIKMFMFNIGYSKYCNLRTTISSGVNINLSKNYKFLYSILSIQDTNLGLAHYFGIEISI